MADPGDAQAQGGAGAKAAGLSAFPSPQRRLGPQGVKTAEPFTPWGPSLRWDDGSLPYFSTPSLSRMKA